MWFCLRLPFRFDPNRLAAEVDQFSAETWVRHFNTGYFEGEWSGLALRSVEGDPHQLYPAPSQTCVYSDTPLLARCPAVQEVLETLRCRATSVRFLKVTPGSRILEHKDYDLGYADGEVRLHVPIRTNPEVHFYVNGRRIPLQAGECWYMDFNRLHRVENGGTTDRIHLVLDCQVNDWLRELFEQTDRATTEYDLFGSISRGGFEAFRTYAFEHPELLVELRQTADRREFFSTTVRRGEAHGFHFTADDLQSAMETERRSWFQVQMEPTLTNL
ncbi:MAG: aspartyl/asparaginyl beta-hydroxylase domain-containing protein [Blastocatellia bacterium]|nr:aspartyl/asparaginyl beta-hydroxylase domain-containing protein [Blastocatellia bacterium]